MNIHDQDTFRRGKKEGMAEGIQQGELQKNIETAKNMLKDEIKQLSDK